MTVSIEARAEADGSISVYVYERGKIRYAGQCTPAEALLGAKRLWLASEKAKGR